MRTFFALLLLAALAVPSSACEWGHGGYRYSAYRGWSQPYWHHPYYARFGFQRPYLYYRQLRSFGYAGYLSGPFVTGMFGGCGGAYFYTYYPAYVSVAPIYSRLGVALSLEDTVFSRRDRDGLPRPRTKPVGSRFLKDIR
jgi:hypothetical protein